MWIPKEENSEKIDQFRMMSLLSVEEKIFFSVMATRLTEYFLENKYIDTSVQKGGIPGVPGCLKHTGVDLQLLREARENKGNLVVLWLDLANAYGSIPHRLVEKALQKHHVPENIREPIMDYYNNFHVRVSAGPETSDWCRLEIGIITGCTLSVILFSLAINMLVKSAIPITTVVMRAREVLQYRDPKVVGAGVTVKTGRKWRAEKAVEGAEMPLQHKMVIEQLPRGKPALVCWRCLDMIRHKVKNGVS